VDPFNEEKGEVRTGNNSHSTSAVTTPEAEVVEVAEAALQHGVDHQLDFALLANANLPEESLLRSLHCYIVDHQLLVGPLNLDKDHPLEEVVNQTYFESVTL